MSISNKEIVEACIPILRKAREKETKEKCFLTSYQIWMSLRKENPEIRARIEKSEGKALGKKGGSYKGPAKRIGSALGRAYNRIETKYFDTRYLIFSQKGEKPFGASGRTCGIFRIKKET
ncbi:MAG TPA: hypothetical protein VMX13_09705 [Sedimentisphaerales bacterium]|nr:hypothetical protein [Sedimentisphaerales bacterium]